MSSVSSSIAWMAPETFGVALDLGHLADAGLAIEDLPPWNARIDELQLKGPASRPPPGDFPLEATLGLLPEPPAVVCVEHREPIRREAFDHLVTHLR